jgi:electron transfer flavoprotein alpha subunit
VTALSQWGGMLAAARRLNGQVTAVVVGTRALTDAVASTGPDEVRWVEPAPDVPVEAYAASLAEAAAQAAPRVLVSTAEPAARVLLGAASARLGSALIPGMIDLAMEGEQLIVRRSAFGGEVVETVATAGPVATIFAGDDVETHGGSPALVTVSDVPAADLAVIRTEPIAAATGVNEADRVVAFGRGVRARDDVALIEQLATALTAELACSMPIADDLRWLEKARYIGRSGQHIAPRLYLAIGIAGAPQHMEGVRAAKVVAAINIDPKAPIFRVADYGVVGDLYEVVPALVQALSRNNARGAGT